MPTDTNDNGVYREYKTAWNILVYLVFAGYIVLTLWPLVYSGYYSDDLMESSMRGRAALNHNSSYFELVYEQTVGWIKNNGRFQPTGKFLSYPIIYFTEDVRTYKSIILLMVITNALLLSYMVKCLIKDRYAALLPMLMLPLFIQFRMYHDPVLSFTGFLQLFMSFLICSIIFYSKYLDSGRPRYLVLSLLCFNIALYYTETCLPLFLLYVAMVIVKSPDLSLKQKILKLIPHTISLIVAIVINIIVKLLKNPNTSYEGLVVNLDPTTVVKTFFIQFYSMLPMSYYLNNPSQFFNHDFDQIVSGILLPDIMAVLFLVVAYYLIVRNMQIVTNTRVLVFLGLPLVIFPALLISVSQKYQSSLLQLGLGMGYIQVYIQYFGALLIMLGMLLYLDQRLVGRYRKVLHILVVALTATVLLLNMQSNRAVVDKSNIDLHFRREALVEALRGKILGDVPNNSRLVILDEYNYDPYPRAKSDLKGWAAGGYPWKNDALIYQYSGKRMIVYGDLDKLRDANKSAKKLESETYALTIKSFPPSSGVKNGFVELSRLADITTDAANQVHYRSQLLKIYRSNNAL